MRRAAPFLPLLTTLLLLLAAPAASGAETDATVHSTASAAGGAGGQRIVGGGPAQVAQWPSAAYLAIDQGGGRGVGCSGTVVARGAILTAAHCVTDAAGALHDPSQVTVVTGRSDLRDAAPGTVHGALQIAVHPGYDPRSARFDAALVALDSVTTAPPIALATGAAPEPGAAEIGGWGAVDGSGTPTAVLRAATTTLLPDADCARTLEDFDVATMLCAADLERRSGSVCHGDSGGPLALRRADGSLVQVGVTSWGSSGCDPRAPQAFVRVGALAGWLAAHVSGMEPPPAGPAAGDAGPAALPTAGAGIAAPARGGSARGGSADGRRAGAHRTSVSARRPARAKRCRATAAGRRGRSRTSSGRRGNGRVAHCLRRARSKR